MMSSLFIEKLSERERRLAATVGILLIVCALFFRIVRPILDEWEGQEGRIETMTGRLDFLRKVLGMKESVDAQYETYRDLLTQESSDEVVRNELMQDINRISGQSRIRVPEIRQALTEFYPDYKRYVVEIDIEGTVANLASFLANLQKSKKLFRVEKLEITKKTSAAISGRMEASRILVSASGKQRLVEARPAAVELQREETEKNLIVNGDMERWKTGWGSDRYPDSWSGKSVTTARSTEHAVSGFAAAKLTGRDAGSVLYQDVKVDPGSRYQLTAHMRLISGTVWLQVRDRGDRSYYGEGEEGAMSVEGRSMRAYTLIFTTLGGPGSGERTLRFTLHFRARDSAAYVDDVRLVKLGTGEEGTKEK